MLQKRRKSLLDAAHNAVYNSPLFVNHGKRFFSFIFSLLALHSVVVSAASSLCREILKSPFERNEVPFKKEVFDFGDALLNNFFKHTDFALLKQEQKEAFVLQNKRKIIENLILQGAIIEPVGKTTAYVVRGGESRLGRIAAGLKRIEVIVLVDIETLLKMNASGFYSPKRHMILLGLEDALYPNQISYNLLHEAMHASIDHKALFIPRIYDEVESKTYEDFSLDEVIVYSKQVLQMVNKKVESQNSESVGAGRNKNLLAAVKIFKELSLRTLHKKNELLKVIDFLKKVEENPSILKGKAFSFSFEGLDPQIILFKSGFMEYMPYQVTEELMQSDPSVRFKVFQGDGDSYAETLKRKAHASRVIIEEALYFAESAYNQSHDR
jgi:hypothetical protein